MRNLAQYPLAPYQGPLISKSINDGAKVAQALVTVISWFNYSAGGQPLGSTNPNFTVLVNLQNAGTGNIPANFQIRSVYVDNDGSNFPVYVFFPDTQYTVSCPPNSSGWFKVFSLSQTAFVTAVGISNVDVSNQARTAVFFSDTQSVPYVDPEQATAVDFGLASPLITFGGSGGGLSNIGILLQGSGYLNGGLSVSGGGGVGATAGGTIDAFGRFTSTFITSPGTGYTGFPIISPTAGHGKIPPWAAGTLYTVGQAVIDPNSNTYWICTTNVTFGNFNTAPSQVGPPYWQNEAIFANVTAAFNVNVTAISPAQTLTNNTNYAPRALGDQSQNLVDTVNAQGTFRDNLFGTPYGSGFIYITNAFVRNFANGAMQWNLGNTAGGVLWNFDTVTAGGSGTLLDLQGCNIRLPATAQWRLVCTGVTTPETVSHGWSYTYSQF